MTIPDYAALAEEFIAKFLTDKQTDSTKIYIRVFADWLGQLAKLEQEQKYRDEQDVIWAKRNK